MQIRITKKGLCFFLFLLPGVIQGASAQTRIVLDNYFNHEVDSQTGKSFHYLWSDTTNGGFSQLGELFEAKGASLHTLTDAPRRANLDKADVYIIVDPDTKMESAAPNYLMEEDIRAIVQWVKKGGVLLLMANDSGNCEFEHLNHLAQNFGMHFNEVSLNHVAGNQWEMGAITDLPQSPVFSRVHKVYMKELSSITLSDPAKPVLVKDDQVFMAKSQVGKGFVLAVGDPWIYNEYIDHAHLPESFENHQAAVNLTAYLITLSENARGQ